MPEFGIIESLFFDAPDLFLEHTTFTHRSRIEWDALNRLATISEEAFVTSLMRSVPSDGQRLDLHEFMSRELAESNRRGLTLSRPSRTDALYMETYFYSGEGIESIVAESMVPRS